MPRRSRPCQVLGDTVQPLETRYVSTPCHHPTSGHAHTLELFLSAVYKDCRIRDPCRPHRVGKTAVEAARLDLLRDTMSSLFHPLCNTFLTGLQGIHTNNEQIDCETGVFRGLHRAQDFVAGKRRFATEP